jgi:hypothetical protein
VPTLDEIYSTIDDITAKKLMKIAREIFDERNMSYLIMEPEQQKVLTNGHAVLV